MNEEYPDELFACQTCKNVKEHTTLLECFHNICDDCEQNNEDNVCGTCPYMVTLPERDHRIKHPLNEILIEVLYPPKETKQIDSICKFCEENNDTKFCRDCKTFWCETDLNQVHHKVIHMGVKHQFIPAKEVSFLDINPLPEGEGVGEDERELDELMNKLHKLEGKGNQNQENIRRDQKEVEEFRRNQEETVYNIFDEIIEQLKRNKTEIVQDINYKCNSMQEILENKQEENDKKMSVIRRGVKMLDKMKQHKTKSNSIKEFLTNCRFLETNHTSSPVGVVRSAEMKKLQNLPQRLKSDKFQANIVYVLISFARSKLIVKSQNTAVLFHIELYSEGNDPNPISGDVGGTSVQIEITGDNKTNPSYTKCRDYEGDPKITCHFPPGNYKARLLINSRPKQEHPFSIAIPQKEFEALNPHIRAIDEPGLLRAVASAGNYLYCVVKDPPEIRKYSINQDEFDAGSSISLEITIGEGNLATPCGICYVDEHLYVMDAGHNCIYVFTNNGDYVDRIGRAGKELGEFQRPMGIDFDRLRKDILIADTFNNRIQILNMATKEFTQFGSNETLKLKEPVDVKALRNGNTILTTLAGLILLYDNARKFTNRIMTDILTPRHCCVDSCDAIYVTSHLGHSVYKLTQRVGEFEEFEKINLKTHPEFRNPTGITIDKNGNLYVVSRELNPKSTKSFLSIW